MTNSLYQDARAPSFRMTNVGFRTTQFENAEALAAIVADKWCRQIGGGEEPFHRCAVRGRIANDFFREVAARANQDEGIRQAHFFGRTNGVFRRATPTATIALHAKLLLEPLEIEPSHIHRIRGEDEPAKAAAAASDELLRIAPLNAAGQPIIDWCFWGWGRMVMSRRFSRGRSPAPGFITMWLDQNRRLGELR
jgi:hypothetical protein